MGDLGQKDELSSIITSIVDVDLTTVQTNPQSRSKLLSLARNLTAVLEGPINRATELFYKPYFSIASRIAADLNLFEHIALRTSSVSSKELATLSGADELLISRILRLLASGNYVEEPEENRWSANDTTIAMKNPAIAAGQRVIYDVLVASAIKAPKFFEETQYKVPVEPTDTVVQYANSTKLPFFEFLHLHPSLLQDYNHFMGNTLGAREYWYEWYDVQGRFIEGFDHTKSSTLLVDVGGGKGHDLKAFDNKFGKSSVKGEYKLVLQDLPQVLAANPDHELPATISKVGHNFFDKQPEKGARGYFLHHVLHDWSDKYCLQILENIRRAMTPGYSKLLIHELILPNTGATEIQTRYDIIMMTLNGGLERSKSQWIRLLQKAGFCNIMLHEHRDTDHDGVIEAEVSES